MLKPAFVKYVKAILDKKFGKEKSPEKKAFKQAVSAEDGLLGSKGFVVKKVLADPKEFDYYCGTERMGEALSGESGLVVCEWTGATSAVFYVITSGVKAVKY